jgi:hypothetical protein
MGLTDNQQALITLISASLIAIGALSAPIGAPWWFMAAVEICGVLGLTLKEFLGIAPVTPNPASNPAPVNPPSPPASPPSLPVLPAGFSVADAKAAGFQVYENASGNVVLVYQGQDETIFGTVEQVDLTGYSLL